MSYVTVSTWAYDETLDEAALVESAQEKINQIKAMGASGGYLVRVSPNEGMIVMIYPDEGIWNRVRDTVLHMRAETRPEVGGTPTGAMNGPAVVSV